jgi:hypothetical protein
MTQAAKRLSPLDASEHAARVARVEGEVLVLRSDAGDLRARRATSCLVQPATGDLVLAAMLGDGSAYVLAVLERGDEHATTELRLDGDVSLRVREGRFDIHADQAVELVSPERVKLTSAEVEIVSRRTSLLFDELRALGREALLDTQTGRVIGRMLETVADVAQLTAKRAVRIVTELDQTRAKNADHMIEKNLSITADNASVMATSLVRMDGSNIQLG